MASLRSISPRMNGYDSFASSVTRWTCMSVGPVGTSRLKKYVAPEIRSIASSVSKDSLAEIVNDSIHFPSST